MTTNRMIAAAVASVLSISAPAGVTADALEEVIVTGRAGTRELTKPELSFAATTIDADRLRFIAPLSTAEVFKSVPGFWVEASGGEASNNVRARGIPTDSRVVGLWQSGARACGACGPSVAPAPSVRGRRPRRHCRRASGT